MHHLHGGDLLTHQIKTDLKHFSADLLDSNSIGNAIQQWTSLWRTWKTNYLQVLLIMINMFCLTFYLILIITLIISGLGDMNLHWRLKAMLETFLKDSYSKTYTDHYNFVFCTSFSVRCIVLFFVFTVLLRSDSGFYTLNWIELNWTHTRYTLLYPDHKEGGNNGDTDDRSVLTVGWLIGETRCCPPAWSVGDRDSTVAMVIGTSSAAARVELLVVEADFNLSSPVAPSAPLASSSVFSSVISACWPAAASWRNNQLSWLCCVVALR